MPSELLESIAGAQRSLHGTLPASVHSSAGRALIDRLERQLGLYLETLRAALPWKDLGEFYRTRQPEFEGRRMERVEREAIAVAAAEILERPIESVSKDLFDVLLEFVPEAYLEGESQVQEVILEAAFQDVEAGRVVPVGVSQWAKAHCAEAVTGINAESKRRLAGIVARGIEQGRGVDGTARDVGKAFTDMNLHRRRLIASTEISKAMSTGAFDRAYRIGSQQKQAISVGDKRVCELCITNEIAGRIPIGEAFPSGHMMTPFKPGCRCGVTYFGARGIGSVGIGRRAVSRTAVGIAAALVAAQKKKDEERRAKGETGD